MIQLKEDTFDDGFSSRIDPQDLDERRRHQYKVLLQYLREKELFETLSALESETGVKYSENDLPVSGVLEASLDMFGHYRNGENGSKDHQKDNELKEAEEALQQLVDGACCTGPCTLGVGPNMPFPANVTSVCWAAVSSEELLIVVATTDRRLRLLGGPEGQVLTDFSALASPPLGVDVASVSQAALASIGFQEILVTTMGGEVHILHLKRPVALGDRLVALIGDPGTWSIEQGQTFKDHQKHVSAARFAPTSSEADVSKHFVSVSRDHKVHIYTRGHSVEAQSFVLTGTIHCLAEATSCAWVSDSTFVFAVRDDNNLHYWDVDKSDPASKPKERQKTNLNALGDSVVSFTVLALAVSPDGSLVAACTDKSRVILLKACTDRQLRNFYGATINEFDVPGLCFSLDSCFLYVTSTLPVPLRKSDDMDSSVRPIVACGQLAIFEVRSSSLVLQLPCHEKAVRCLDRHPRSEIVVTGSFDKTVKLWG